MESCEIMKYDKSMSVVDSSGILWGPNSKTDIKKRWEAATLQKFSNK